MNLLKLTAKFVLALFLLVTPTLAQTPNNDALFGTFNLRNDAARIRLATNSEGTPVSLSTLTFDWTNGPPEEINYKNHTWSLGYNVDFNGTKVVPGVVSYGAGHESKYRNGLAGAPGSFMSEHHFFTWQSPNSAIYLQPLDGTVQYDTGKFDFAIRGEVHFFRNYPNTAYRFAHFYDTGLLDMREAPDAAIAFKNNAMGMLFMKADNSNSIKVIGTDTQNRVVISPWGYNIFLAAPVEANTIDVTGDLKVGTLKLKDNGTLYAVSIGPADSCGTGYRCLKVLN